MKLTNLFIIALFTFLIGCSGGGSGSSGSNIESIENPEGNGEGNAELPVMKFGEDKFDEARLG